MSSKTPLYTVPVPSTSFSAEAFWDGQGSSPSIRFAFEKDGEEVWTGISFRRVAAMRKRAERCCTEWHIGGAYDTLVEVANSPWVAEVQSDTPQQLRDTKEMHHFMIYLDSVGCFEVIAESWSPLREEKRLKP